MGSKHTLYRLVFPNGKVYVGQTNNFTQRMRQHESAANKGYSSPVYKAISKYGWINVTKEIILVCAGEEIDMLERHYISKHRSVNPLFGYNLESGGNLNKRHAEATKEKMRSKALGRKHSNEVLKKLSAAKLGVPRQPHSSETKIKMSLARKGRPKSDEHRKAMSFAKKGKTTGMVHPNRKAVVKECPYTGEKEFFPSMRDAANSTPGWRVADISHVANGQRKTAYGFKWSFINNNSNIN